MPTNDFLPFATAGGANVLSQSGYAAAGARSAGVIAGTASSALANKSWRQSAVMAAMLGQFISDYGNLDALDDGNVANLVRDFARSVQAGKFAYVVATGTANAWTVAPTPALAAYAAGRPLNIIAPATNTSTTVDMNVSGLGNRRIKKRNGNDPAIGDLIAGEVYPTIDDGTSIRILTPLPSDMVAASRVAAVQAFVAPSATNTVASSSTASKIVNFGTVTNNIADVATWASSRLTIVKSGWYQISVNLDSNMPLGTDYGYSFSVVRNGGSSIVGANGISRSTGVLGPFASASALYQLTAADYLEVFAAHNFGSSQNMPIRFTAKFEGV